MRIKFGRLSTAILAGSFLANIAVAHPGHESTDLAAQLSQPLAGADHFAAFIALTSVLLLALRIVVKCRRARPHLATTSRRVSK
jgi:hydrogenase/urease accessory protein HupE